MLTSTRPEPDLATAGTTGKSDPASALELQRMFSNPDLDRGQPTVSSPKRVPRDTELRNIFSNPNLPRGLPVSTAPAPLASELDLRRIFSNPEMHTPTSTEVRSQAQRIRDSMTGNASQTAHQPVMSGSAEVLSPAMRISEDMDARRDSDAEHFANLRLEHDQPTTSKSTAL